MNSRQQAFSEIKRTAFVFRFVAKVVPDPESGSSIAPVFVVGEVIAKGWADAAERVTEAPSECVGGQLPDWYDVEAGDRVCLVELSLADLDDVDNAS